MTPSTPRRDRHASAPPEQNEAVRSWLQLHLDSRRMSIRELARRAGINYSALSRILRNEASPRWSTVERLAAVLGDHPFGTPLPARIAAVARVVDALVDDPVLEPTDRRHVLRFYLRVRRSPSPLGLNTARR